MWSLALTVILKVIDIFLSRSQRKELMKRKAIEFSMKHSTKIKDNARIKKQYKDILSETSSHK